MTMLARSYWKDLIEWYRRKSPDLRPLSLTPGAYQERKRFRKMF
jgi:hypothetical protein